MRLRNYGETPADNAWQKEHAAGERARYRGEKIHDPQFERILEHIDFDLINRHLQRECRRSGSDTRQDALLTKDSFLLLETSAESDNDLFESGPESHQYGMLARLVRLYPEKVRSQAKELGVKVNAWFLFVLCHEAVHDYSVTDIRGARDFYESISAANILKQLFLYWQNPPDRVMRTVSGYKKTEHRYGVDSENPQRGAHVRSKKWFLGLDEGVTDKAAFELMSEYAQEHPDFVPSADVKAVHDAFGNPRQKMGHGRAMAMVDELVSALGASSGLDRSTVWQAIKRGKFGGDTIHEPQTQAILETTLPEGLYRRLERSA